MKTRLLSVLLVFLLLASVSIPAVSAIPVANAHPAAPAAGIAFDVINEVLNPIEKITLFLQEQRIINLKENHTKYITQISVLSNSLPDIQRKCIENQQKIRKQYEKIIDERQKCNKNNTLTQIRDEQTLKRKISYETQKYKLALDQLENLKRQTAYLDQRIIEEEKRCNVWKENAMTGHEIMSHIYKIEEENRQLKEENRQLKEESKQLKAANEDLTRKNKNVYDVIKEIVKENETMLKMLDR